MSLNNSNTVSIELPGWNQHWEDLFVKYEGPYLPGRICTVQKTRFEVIIPGDAISVPLSGALKSQKMYPVVGDFVVILNQPESATRMIVAILPRRTVLSRGGAGDYSGKQELAANIDTVFIVTEPGSDMSISRLERYLLITRSSGAQPVIVINKSDTCSDIPTLVKMINSEIRDIPVIPVSATEKTGLDHLNPYFDSGKTVIFIGSSGVGKSTLTNALTGKTLQTTGEIREDDGKGRHTTTVRHLLTLPDGSSLIDTPGLREIRIWTAGESVAETFDDIIEYATRCRFTDCSHNNEPGCAVRKAIEDGVLSHDRFTRYQKILKEISFEREKADIGLKRFEKKRFREISKLSKEITLDRNTGKYRS
ncbi:ribosome small subunit-dependent GTPase A [Methanospirillum lacunae]|uniref:Ribosome small subunit-dependent GTPase A n=1 Tax=Methanospirillum lacunae TaxID=668570 RepID=A0A2V2MUF0_9EURY|nr:ribosome small subunit-dependent GTPase A [Methanospirillum lacunae]PWR69795.1 ribosome small subunit-dependent GTPase A [Methanospirillum lacunae]